jgi:hypothetical protein
MKTNRLLILIWMALFLIAFNAITNDFFEGLLGNDYSYFLPWLLAGYFWFLENGFAIPWFSPALCAGIPHFANPQSLFYSVPQLLTLMVDPRQSLVITAWIFGIAAFGGTVLLASLWTRSVMTMVFAGFTFALNGMALSRMYEGHLTFHAFMLLPLICYLLLRPGRDFTAFVEAALAGVLMAYFIHAGAGVIVIPVGICILLILVTMGRGLDCWGKLLIAAGSAFALSLGKLVAVAHFMVQFPRDLYPMPGAGGLLDSLYLTIRSLVWPLSKTEVEAIVVNTAFPVDQVEVNYAVGFAPVIIGLAWVFLARSRLIAIRPSWRWALVLPILTLPVVLNTYHPALHSVLGNLPYFSQASTLFRWNLIYILPVVLLCVRALDQINRPWLAPMAILAFLASVVTYMPTGLRYTDATSIVTAYASVRGGEEVPKIRNLEESLIDGMRVPLGAGGDSLTRGASQIVCSEPLFGYVLESFRFDAVFKGPVFRQHAGAFNFYRPECLLFPAQNQCEKGDRFPTNKASELVRFMSYRPFDFDMPKVQRISNWISMAGFAGMLVLLITWVARWVRRSILRQE